MKKGLKIVLIGILIVGLIGAGIFGIIYIQKDMEIYKTKEILSGINSKELETKIIEKLKTTSMNVNTSSLKTIFGTAETLSEEFEEISKLRLQLSIHYGKNYNPYEDYVSAYIINKDENGIVIPCFKIVSDDKGNFMYILYLNSSNFEVSRVVDKVFKEDYGINIDYNNSKYYNKFIKEGNLKYQENIQIYISNEEIASTAIREVLKNTNLYNLNDTQLLDWLYKYQTLTLVFFGRTDQ